MKNKLINWFGIFICGLVTILIGFLCGVSYFHYTNQEIVESEFFIDKQIEDEANKHFDKIYSFILAINDVEASSKVHDVPKGKAGEIGPLQISEACFIDSGFENAGYQHESCNNFHISMLVAISYFKRYEQEAYESLDYQSLARLWNGGPSWRLNRERTDEYWGKVKKALIIGDSELY